jgi:hypothetical protein
MYVIIPSIIGVVAVILGVYLTYLTGAYRRENVKVLNSIKSLKIGFEKKMKECKRLCEKRDDTICEWQRIQDGKIDKNSNLLYELKGLFKDK